MSTLDVLKVEDSWLTALLPYKSRKLASHSHHAGISWWAFAKMLQVISLISILTYYQEYHTYMVNFLGRWV